MTKLRVLAPAPQTEAGPGLRRVFVRDLVLPCRIGARKHEHGRRQRVRFNLDLTVHEGDGPIEDRLTNVVCYEDIVRGVRRLAAAGHIHLVETLAEQVAEMCLTDARVASARVRVEKLDVFADATAVGVEIVREAAPN
ncbi:MAG: dihydroneopterin aldolase [Alphaproteobacteria bacterium]